MEVIVLVGSSGTGKSFRAINVAKAKNAQYIIDDGLLIKGNKVLGGYSAKREKSKMAAIKRAIFVDPVHRQQIKDILKKENPNKILILGTSEKMVESIVNALDLGEIHEWIKIENISTEEERRLAKKSRRIEGKHVIPVPTFEIKKDFSGYFLNPLKIFRNLGKEAIEEIDDYSVVRPTFSYMGKYTIANRVIEDLVYYAANKIIGIYKVGNIDIKNTNHGLIIDISLRIVYGNPIRPLVQLLQNQVKVEIEEMTSFNVLMINVQVKNLVMI